MVEFNCAVLSPWWAFFSGRERILRPLPKASQASSRLKQFGSTMQKSNFTMVFPVWTMLALGVSAAPVQSGDGHKAADAERARGSKVTNGGRQAR